MEKLELSDEEMSKGVERMARGMNISIDEANNYLSQNQDLFINFQYTQLAAKAVDIIIDKGNITEVEPELAKESESETGGPDTDSEKAPESENNQVEGEGGSEGEGIPEANSDENPSQSDKL